jgi:uncharacterized coiled-coil protein SlyX
MKGINDLIENLNFQIVRQASAIEEMMATISNTAATAQKKQSAIQNLVNNVREGRASMQVIANMNEEAV